MCVMCRVVARHCWVSALLLAWRVLCDHTANSPVFLTALWHCPFHRPSHHPWHRTVTQALWTHCSKLLSLLCTDASIALSTCYLSHIRCVTCTVLSLQVQGKADRPFMKHSGLSNYRFVQHFTMSYSSPHVSVCLLVGLDCEPCKNGWADGDAI